MKRGTPDHLKTKRLIKHLRVPLYTAVGLLELLFHFAAKYAPQGDVGRYPDDEIAGALGWHGEGTRLVEAIHKAGYLDPHPEHRWVIHDWADHADEAVKKLLRRQGLSFIVSRHTPDMSGRGPDMSSLPEPKPEPKPEPEPLRPRSPLALEGEDLSDVGRRMFERHRRGRKATLKATLDALFVKVGNDLNPLASALAMDERHARWCQSHDWTKKGGEFVPWLEDWIRGVKSDAEPPEPEFVQAESEEAKILRLLKERR